MTARSIAKRFERLRSLDPRRPELWLLGAVLGGSALLLAFAWIVGEVLEGDTAGFDHRVFLLLRDPTDATRTIGPDWLFEAMRDLTSLGSVVVLTLVVLSVVGYLLIAKKRRAAAFVLVAVLSGQLLSTALKLAMNRARPELLAHSPQVFTASFPSGHAMLSAVTYITLGALLAQFENGRAPKVYVLGVALTLTFLVGFSRVYLGVHWATDVLAGWCLGAAWALLWWIAVAWLRRHRAEA